MILDAFFRDRHGFTPGNICNHPSNGWSMVHNNMVRKHTYSQVSWPFMQYQCTGIKFAVANVIPSTRKKMTPC